MGLDDGRVLTDNRNRSTFYLLIDCFHFNLILLDFDHRSLHHRSSINRSNNSKTAWLVFLFFCYTTSFSYNSKNSLIFENECETSHSPEQKRKKKNSLIFLNNFFFVRFRAGHVKNVIKSSF